jgi:hypothetical protein
MNPRSTTYRPKLHERLHAAATASERRPLKPLLLHPPDDVVD